jgi:Fe2+ or Zn2+ uptake regulation protein
MTTEIDRELVEELRARNQRVTSQRLVIHRILRERETHLSAEEVHREALDALPGVSLPTVYATLELLTEMGLTTRIDAGTGTVLFDGRRESHHHAVCRVCGCVWDLAPTVDLTALAQDAREAGLRVDGVQVLATGTCADCDERNQIPAREAVEHLTKRSAGPSAMHSKRNDHVAGLL